MVQMRARLTAHEHHEQTGPLGDVSEAGCFTYAELGIGARLRALLARGERAAERANVVSDQVIHPFPPLERRFELALVWEVAVA